MQSDEDEVFLFKETEGVPGEVRGPEIVGLNVRHANHDTMLCTVYDV